MDASQPPASPLDAGVGPSSSDSDLLRGFITAPEAHRQVAFRHLVERHGPMVAGVCRRIAGDDADDAMQAVFLVLARRAGELTDHPSLGGWLHRTAVQIALRQRDARSTRRRHEQEAAMPIAAPSAGHQAELRAELDAALDQLPARYRAPLVLHYFEGRSQAEVAASLSVSVNTLTSLLSRAREHLRARLTKRGLTVSLTLLTAVLGSEAAAATLSPAGVDAACRAGSGAASPAVAALADSVPSAGGPAPTALAVLTVTALAAVASVVLLRPADQVPAALPIVHEQPVAGQPSVVDVAAPTITTSEARAIFASFPPAVRATASEMAGPGSRVHECDIKTDAGVQRFEVEIELANGQHWEWLFAADGSVISQVRDLDEDDAVSPPAPKPRTGEAF